MVGLSSNDALSQLDSINIKRGAYLPYLTDRC